MRVGSAGWWVLAAVREGRAAAGAASLSFSGGGGGRAGACGQGWRQKIERAPPVVIRGPAPQALTQFPKPVRNQRSQKTGCRHLPKWAALSHGSGVQFLVYVLPVTPAQGRDIESRSVIGRALVAPRSGKNQFAPGGRDLLADAVVGLAHGAEDR